MKRPDDAGWIEDILVYARESIALLGEETVEHLESNRLLQLALTHLVEIIGEAARRVSTEGRLAHPSVPWPALTGMRNRLVHEYRNIDLRLLYATVRVDLPLLVELLGNS